MGVLIYFYTLLFNLFIYISNYLFILYLFINLLTHCSNDLLLCIFVLIIYVCIKLFIYFFLYLFICIYFHSLMNFLCFILFFMHHFTLFTYLYNYDKIAWLFTDAFHFFSFMGVLICFYTFLFN